MQRVRDIRSLQATAARSRCFAHPDLALQVLDGKITCKKCNGSLKIEAIPSETHKFMTGQTQSAAVHSKLTQKYGAWDMTTEVTDVALIEPEQADIERVGKKFADTIEHFGATGEAELSRADVVLAAKLEMAGFQAFHFYVDQRRFKDKQGKWHVKSKLRMNIAGRYFNAQRSMGATYGGVTLEIISDKATKEAAQVEDGEVLVQATLTQKRADGTEFIRQQSFGRAGGSRDANQPVAKTNKLEMAETRAEARVLERGAQLGVPIGTYAEVAGVVVVSDGEAEVKALEAPATWPDPDGNPGATYPAEDDSVPPENVDTTTGEITNLNTKANQQDLVQRLKASDIGEKELEKFHWRTFTGLVAAIEMLRSGKTPQQIAVRVVEQLSPSKKEDPPVTVDESTNEDVEELPW